jgi:outer membrane protein OmpA-like peptidoglycan-associated protein
MCNKIILVGLIAALTAAPAFADSASKEEGVGVGLGATIGGIAGGPVGIILGAAIGARFGDEMHQRNEAVDSLSASLQGSQNRVSELEQDIDALGGDLQRLREESRPGLLSLLQAGIEMDLLFRTDEHQLAASTGSRLQQLAASLATMSDVFVQLDGFADERGDAAYNQKLSDRRATHVRDVLVANGVPAERINVKAHGESQAADDSVDSFAFERKVSLTLYIENPPSFASNPK